MKWKKTLVGYIENLITTSKRTTATLVALGDPFPGPKIVLIKLRQRKINIGMKTWPTTTTTNTTTIRDITGDTNFSLATLHHWLLTSARSLLFFCRWLCLSVRLSVCLSVTNIASSFCCSLESSHVLAVSSPWPLLQNVVLRFST